MKKYEFTGETKSYKGRTLHRIKALRDFRDVKAGDIGGWIEKKKNLSQKGDCWVYTDAKIYGNAKIGGNTKVYGDAKVYSDAEIKTTNDYIIIGPIGSRNDVTTAFKTTTGVKIKCGCFYRSIEEFESKVRKTHGSNQYAKEYLAFAKLLKIRFGEE